MAHASYYQSSFLGGEWSPQAQGRFDRQDYRTALSVARNVIPITAGSAPRRAGTRFAATSRKGLAGSLKSFYFDQAHPYIVEFTDARARFFSGASLVLCGERNTVIGISGASPAVVDTDQPHGWTTGDAVQLFLPTGDDFAGVAAILGRQFQITVINANAFSIADPVTGTAFDGSSVDLGTHVVFVDRVLEFVTPYTGTTWANTRIVQDQQDALALNPAFKPYELASIDPEDTAAETFATFSFDPVTLLDGPYFDPPVDGSTITPGALTGTVTLTRAGSIPTFLTTDVGRMMRLLSEPLDWDDAHAYAIGDTVKFADGYFSALKANTGKEPDLDLDNWAIDPSAAVWTWGTIASRVSATQVTLLIKGPDLLFTHAIKTYRMGLYSDSTGWPHTGVYHDGRLWLAGPVKNRVDGSVSNEPFNFSPTGPDGTVADNNACAEVIRASKIQSVRWMVSTDSGLLCGTQHGEWLLHASQQNDPITPTSVQQHQTGQNGCENVEPVETNTATIFVQRHGTKLLEYVSLGTAKFAASDLSEVSKHLLLPKVAELAYQAEPNPVIWGRCQNGSLWSCTYKRELPIGTQPPSFAGFARHDLGNGRLLTSLAAGPSVGGDTDSVTMMTVDDDGVHYVEVMTSLFDDALLTSWFLDAGVSNVVAEQLNATTVRFWGLYQSIGETVSLWVGGLDLGDHVVIAPGYVDVDFTADFTAAYLQTLTTSGQDFGNLAVRIHHPATGTPNIPDRGQIDSFKVTGTRVGAFIVSNAAVDWVNRRLFIYNEGAHSSEADSGFRVFDLDTRLQLVERTCGDLVGSLWLDTNGIGSPIFYAPDGNLYQVEGDGSIVQISGETYLVSKHSSLALVDVPRYGTGIGTSEATYIVLSELTGGAACNVRIVNPGASLGDMAVLNTTSVPHNNVQLVAAGDGTAGSFNYAEAVGLTDDAMSGPRFWRIAASPLGSGTTLTGQVLTADVRPASDWNYISSCILGPYDQTDGNVIIFGSAVTPPPTWAIHGNHPIGDYVKGSNSHVYVSTSNQPDSTDDPVSGGPWTDLGLDSRAGGDFFIAKVNPRTLEVLWTTALADANSIPLVNSFSSPKSRVAQGTFAWISPNDHGTTDFWIYKCHTATGVVTKVNCHRVSLAGVQYYDDVSNIMVVTGGYVHDSVTDNPVPINGTADGVGGFFALPAGPDPTTPFIAAGTYNVPAVAGFPFVSQWQILRPNTQAESGALTGPAFGKTRRSHQYAVMLHNARGISIGTDFITMRPLVLKTSGRRTDLPITSLFSGTIQDTLEDDYSFDSMIALQVSRPYPCTVLVVGGFLATQDRA